MFRLYVRRGFNTSTSGLRPLKCLVEIELLIVNLGEKTQWQLLVCQRVVDVGQYPTLRN